MSTNTSHTADELALAEVILQALDIDDMAPSELAPEAPLFGDDPDGLGLDSIDALEIALAVSQNYDVEVKADDENNKKIFTNVRSLSAYIQANR